MGFFTRKYRAADEFTSTEVTFLINLANGGGGAISILAATGTIDDSNKAFTFTAEPVTLVINGAEYQQTGGAITWTWTSGTKTATLSAPCGVGGSIFGLI